MDGRWVHGIARREPALAKEKPWTLSIEPSGCSVTGAESPWEPRERAKIDLGAQTTWPNANHAPAPRSALSIFPAIFSEAFFNGSLSK